VCGRYSQTGPDPSVLRDRFPIGERVEVRRRFNVAPGDQVLAVTTDREGAPRGEVLRWGLVPHWADDPAKLGLKLINARSETMAEKPAFRDAFARRRCLVVADGFYEWEKRPDGTTQLTAGRLPALAAWKKLPSGWMLCSWWCCCTSPGVSAGMKRSLGDI
jgi:putative SOS response-associated peptidase YedK